MKIVDSIPACIVVKSNSLVKTGINAKFIISKTCVNMWLKLITLKRRLPVILAQNEKLFLSERRFLSNLVYTKLQLLNLNLCKFNDDLKILHLNQFLDYNYSIKVMVISPVPIPSNIFPRLIECINMFRFDTFKNFFYYKDQERAKLIEEKIRSKSTHKVFLVPRKFYLSYILV